MVIFQNCTLFVDTSKIQRPLYHEHFYNNKDTRLHSGMRDRGPELGFQGTGGGGDLFGSNNGR